ncbi:MAG: hypothetical protein CMQ24_06825 [Gammaproteobacteria bacterium]|nr:hypothetical protein [Gammaproteobacteria bacterium]
MRSCSSSPPHQPHFTPGKFAPDRFYAQLPETLTLPANVPEPLQALSTEMYRHYLAMILAIDEMLGRLLDYLEANHLLDDTIVLFASDHGTQGGSQGVNPWSKKNPYDASVHIPAIISYPRSISAGSRSGALTSMVDFFPTVCGLAGVPIPRSVEGTDHSGAFTGDPANVGPDSVFLMNFSKYFDWFQDGAEWRGIRTRTYMYCVRLDGTEELYDLTADPLQMTNIAASCEAPLLAELKQKLSAHQRQRRDELVACSEWACWLDAQRRVIRNASGELSHPETAPDWSLPER